jgi:hypothetical protein
MTNQTTTNQSTHMVWYVATLRCLTLEDVNQYSVAWIMNNLDLLATVRSSYQEVNQHNLHIITNNAGGGYQCAWWSIFSNQVLPNCSSCQVWLYWQLAASEPLKECVSVAVLGCRHLQLMFPCFHSGTMLLHGTAVQPNMLGKIWWS